MTSGIEQKFLDVYGVRQHNNEQRQDYFVRLITKVNDTTDDNWELLTDDAQQWFNRAVKPWAAQKRIPEFPDIAPAPEPDDDESQVDGTRDRPAKRAVEREEEEDQVLKSKRKTNGAAKKPAAKASAHKRKAHTNGEDKKLEFSGGSVVKRAMLRNMQASEQELRDILKKKGKQLSPVRLSLVKDEFKHTMRLLQEDGKLKDHYKVW